MCVAAAFVLLAFSATPALAAPATWQFVDITLFAPESGGVMVLSGELPPSTPLPAEVELAVPAGLQLQWVGEVLGGPVSEDPTLEYTTTTVDGLDVYRFTLTTARTGQVEVLTPGSTAFDGTNYTATIGWKSTQDVPEVRLGVQVPQGATLVSESPGASLQPGDATNSYYTKTIPSVKAGDALDLAVGYNAPATPASAAVPPASGTNPALPIILILAVIAIALVFLVMTRRKPSATPVAEEPVAARSLESEPDDETPAEDEPATSAPSRAGAAKRTRITAAIIAVIVILAVFIAIQTTKPQQVGDTITQVFVPGEACTTAAFPLVVTGDAEPQATADVLFAALKPVTGLNWGTYNAATSSIDVGFCDSETSETLVRQALSTTGMLAESAPATETAAP